MKRSSANLKALAREALSGRFGTPVLAYLIVGALTVTLSMITTGFLDVSNTMSLITSQLLLYVISLLLSLLMAGFKKLILNVNRRTNASVTDLFYVFTHNPDRFLIVNFLMLLAGVLAALPFDIPSFTDNSATALFLTLVGTLVRSVVNIILAAFFGLANYLLLDYPEMGAMDALKESLRLMKGNKGRYLYIYLSFIPLMLASMFSCYIGLLWLEPYMQSTLAFFYMDVTGELDAPNVENSTDFSEPFDFSQQQ